LFHTHFPNKSALSFFLFYIKDSSFAHAIFLFLSFSLCFDFAAFFVQHSLKLRGCLCLKVRLKCERFRFLVWRKICTEAQRWNESKRERVWN
jgi:hypothetical protein